MWYGESNGPCFGYACDLYLIDKFLSGNGGVERNSSSNSYDVQNNVELTGESHFGVEEVEVYQILS